MGIKIVQTNLFARNNRFVQFTWQDPGYVRNRKEIRFFSFRSMAAAYPFCGWDLFEKPVRVRNIVMTLSFQGDEKLMRKRLNSVNDCIFIVHCHLTIAPELWSFRSL
jgi:hypothetical protein